jgi:uncharacterized membrane protein
VGITFGLHLDVLEAGRSHDEIRVQWKAGSALLPDFRGTIRFRIAGTGTTVLLDGTYRVPFGPLGRVFDALAGHQVARASVNDLVARLAAALSSNERDWRARVA